MKTILYVCDENRYSFRRRLSGIYRFANSRNLHVRTMNIVNLGLTVEEALAVTKPKGMIIEQTVIERFKLPAAALQRVPTVIADITEPEVAAGLTGVRLDTDAEVRTAIRALLALDFDNYAFVSYTKKAYWTEPREKVFLETMAARGKKVSVFRPYAFSGVKFPTVLKRMGDWLSDLPKPCGILAVNDEVGDTVLEVASACGIPIPESLAVIGIDNDELICNNTVPPLASVAPDFERSGHLAAEMIAEMIRNPAVTPPPGAYESGDVVMRRSMRPFKLHDTAIMAAIDYIHKHACDGVGVPDVVEHVGAGIRSSQQRFLKLTGHTIFDEIENVRFDRACALLRKGSKKINLIHLECGYGTDRALRDLFKKRTGLSPFEWRMQHA